MKLVDSVAQFLLLYFISITSHASCSGVPGCNPCYDSLLGLSKEHVVCQADTDCVPVAHRCGDFYAVNKAHAKKFIDKKLKTEKSKKIPELECKFDEGWGNKVCRPKK